MSERSKTAELVLGAFLIAAVAWFVGSCGRDPVDETRQDAYETERILRRNRNVLTTARAKRDTITNMVVVRDRSALAQRDSLMSVLVYSDSVFADSMTTMRERELAYAVMRARVTQYVTSYDSLQASTRDLIAANALERLATNAVLAAADSSIAAWKRHADAERRKGWRRFTQGAFVGGIVAVLAVVAL